MDTELLQDLTELTTPASTALFLVTDVADSNTSKKIQYSNLVPISSIPVTVAQGGTGQTSLTSGRILVGNGTSAVSLYTTTGSGTVVALATSPSFTTPTLGVATATSINGLTIDTSTGTLDISNGKTLAASASLTLAGTDGKTLTISNSLTFAGTDSTVMTFPSTTGTVATLAATQTFTNKRTTKRTVTVTQSATPTINTDNTDVAYITGLAQAITSMTTNLSGTPVANDLLWVSITDDGTARAITWGASFEASGTVALPTTTVISTRLDVLFAWNTATSKWRCLAAV